MLIHIFEKSVLILKYGPDSILQYKARLSTTVTTDSGDIMISHIRLDTMDMKVVMDNQNIYREWKTI